MNAPEYLKTFPRMLASATNPDEASIVIAGGADIVDLKDPSQGALGALPMPQIEAILDSIGTSTVTSATIGDITTDVTAVARAVQRIASTGVNFVKVGVHDGMDVMKLLGILEPLCEKIEIVLVFFADQNSNREIAADAARAGIRGIMLDTAGKKNGGLRQALDRSALQTFVAQARQHHLLCGLSGSLTIDDIPPLAELAPDYLGFRGALCHASDRTAGIDREAVAKVRNALNQSANNQVTIPS